MSAPLAGLAAKKSLRVVGLMSGTSADGVDAAIVDVGRGGVEVLAFETRPYSPALRRRVLAVCEPDAAVAELCHLNFVLGEVFAEAALSAARRAGVRRASIDLIGSHGQTVCHLPAARRFGRRTVRSTLQIAEPAVIAERTGIATVADFRTRDVAAGGQGAPLVPYADWRLFGHRRIARAVQNIGGIANVTYLPPAARREDVVAFDTGPGNMILDRLAALVSAGRRRCDRNGALAGRGRVRQRLLDELMRQRFLRRRPPKTTGREDFGRQFADRLFADARRRRIGPPDLLATAAAFTAASIADAYRRFLPGKVRQVVLCGGGARNPTLVEMLRARLAPAEVCASDDLGISADAKEAVCFALLAAETVRGVPNNVPAATGAARAVVCGKIVPAGGPGRGR